MTAKPTWTNHSDLAVKRNPTLSKESFLDWMTFKGGDQIPFIEIFGPIIGLKEQWFEQGATETELDFSAFTYREPLVHRLDINNGRLGVSSKIIEETEEHIIYLDDLGRKLRLCKGMATIPLPLSYPVKNMEDWLAIKPRYEFDESRFGKNWLEEAEAALEKGAVIVADIPGGFDEPRQLLGEEAICYACYDQPELIEDILNTIGDTALKVLDMASSKIQIDSLFVHEDMAGKSGPLWGPREVSTFIKPYYRKVWDMLEGRGARLFNQDSDGNMEGILPQMIDAGLNCIMPVEPGSGMDMVKLRQQYGEKLAFWGGLDKYALLEDKAAIEAELEYKIPPMIKTRGCMLGLDHRIPNGVPLDNYKFYVSKVWEIINREEN
ncbi:MAG: uroporphyrinogen decarboxylase family protein [Sedimentisphaeraceae bacterium JB056]